METTEQELVLQVQEGNAEAFGKIYDLYADRIFRFIKLKVNDQEVAEDILQDVFLKTWKGCQSLQSNEMNFSAWIYRIASNTVNDYYRKKYRTPQMDSIDEHIDLASNESIEGSLNDQLDLRRIENVFRKLPEQYQQILELRFVQDFTLQETATILGKSNLAVRLLQHRALKKLQSLLK
jgi:RNA polymerase sigma-70 factor, ECF subfamily